MAFGFADREDLAQWSRQRVDALASRLKLPVLPLQHQTEEGLWSHACTSLKYDPTSLAQLFAKRDEEEEEEGDDADPSKEPETDRRAAASLALARQLAEQEGEQEEIWQHYQGA